MNDSPAALLAAITELRTQLEAANQRIAALEKVVKITTAEDGTTRTHIESHTLALRGGEDGKRLGLYMGVHKAKPFLHLFAQGTEKEVRLCKLETDPEGECRLILSGRDGRTKALLKVQKGAGLFAAYTPSDTAGVTVQATAGGGSVAVLHPQTGVPRALLIHHTTPEELAAGGTGLTELTFQEAPLQSTVRLRSENGEHSLLLAQQDRQSAVICSSKEEMASITTQSRTDEGSMFANIVTTPGFGRVFLSPGPGAAHAAEAALELIKSEPGLMLKHPNGVTALEAGTTGETTNLTLRTPDQRRIFEIIATPQSVHSCTFFHYSGTPFHQAISNDKSSSLHISSLHDPDLGFLTHADEENITTILHRGPRTLLATGSSEHGGALSVCGSEEGTGSATLCGGKYGGTLTLTNADGQPQATLDTTDYGGRFNIHNDLGFPRITMGVYEESAGLHLNHTGQQGVSAVATPIGGLVMVHDAEGHLRATLPDRQAED